MTWAIDLKCRLGERSDLLIKFPIAKLSLLTGEAIGKTFLAKQILAIKSNQLTQSIHQIKSSQWQVSLKDQNSNIQELKHLAQICYVDWSQQKHLGLNLLSALNLELDFFKLVRDQAKLSCSVCKNQQTADLGPIETQITKLFLGKNCQVCVSAPKENRIEWIKQITALGYERFRLNNKTMHIVELDLIAPTLKESAALFVIIDTLKPEADSLRLQNAILISLKLGNQKFCCSSQDHEGNDNNWTYFGRGIICSNCSNTILDWRDRNNLKVLKALRFELNKLSLAELSTTPIETILNKNQLEPKFQKKLQAKLAQLKDLEVSKLPLLAENTIDQSKLSLIKIITQLNFSNYLIIDHASLGLVDQDFYTYTETLRSISHSCQGVLIVDQHPGWKSRITYQATLSENSVDYHLDLPKEDNLSVSPQSIKKLSSEILKKLIEEPNKPSFVLSPLTDFIGQSEQIKNELESKFRPLSIAIIERNSLEPESQTLYSYFGIEKAFTPYLLKTTAARKAGLTNKSFQKLSPTEQRQFTFKGLSNFSLQNETIKDLVELFSALPDLRRILSFIKIAKLDQHTLATNCALLSRSELDRIKLIKKLLLLPKSCQLVLIQEPLIIFEAEKMQKFYFDLFEQLTCSALVFISNQDLCPHSFELFTH